MSTVQPAAPLLAKLHALQASSAATTAKRKGCTLRTYLITYMRTWKDCYPDYMQGATELAAFLGPISLPRDPRINSAIQLPPMLSSYEIQQLARLLASAYSSKYHSMAYREKWHRAIILTLVDMAVETINSSSGSN